MKIGRFTLFSFLTLVISCSQEETEGRTSAVRLDIELGTYLSEDGKKHTPEWKSEYRVGIRNMASGELQEVSPLLGGSSSSMFLVNFETVGNGIEILAYYPVEAFSPTAESSSFSVNIPSNQSGDAVPYQMGSVPYKYDATIRMEPFGCLFYAHVGKGDYSIERAVLKSNAGEKISGMTEFSFADKSCTASEDEIGVILETSLECSGSSQCLTFLTAPVSLSSGYTLEFTTTAGKILKYTASEKVELQSGSSVHSGNYLSLLCLGNSFTRQQNPAAKLEQLASSQGYCLNISKFTKDGYYFGDSKSTALVTKGGFETSDKFDSLLRHGMLDIAGKAGAWVSPIGPGFIVAREKYPETGLYNTDSKHQSVYGAYLKACVNYLVLTREKFSGAPSDCGLEANKAKAMMECAEEVVLGKESEDLIKR